MTIYYYHDPQIGSYTYGPGHPMKPLRIAMAHELILGYDLHHHLVIKEPSSATPKTMTRYHSDEYIDYITRVTPDTAHNFADHTNKFNPGDDCPLFDGLIDFCASSAGGSIDSAVKLNSGDADVCVNYAGGLHHARKCEASGFCYVNDIVLAALELLRYHSRVLYVDIDIHHGDGVEEAFYTTDRVMTVSFHKYGDKFFPGTGDLKDVGLGKGKGYAVNVPLRDGINDISYETIFRPVMDRVLEWYRPGAVILQCGADSLAGDRLGCFNLSMEGHGACVEYFKKKGLPLMILGGGGYTIRNVARAWTYETSVLCGVELPKQLPYNHYFEYYAPDYTLAVPMTTQLDANTPQYLDSIKESVFETLRNLHFAPSVQMQHVPRDEEEIKEEGDPEIRFSEKEKGEYKVPHNDYIDPDYGYKEGFKYEDLSERESQHSE